MRLKRPRGILKEYFLGLKRVGSIPNIPATCVSSSPNIVRRTSRLDSITMQPVNNECWLVPENKVGSGSGQKVASGRTMNRMARSSSRRKTLGPSRQLNTLLQELSRQSAFAVRWQHVWLVRVKRSPRTQSYLNIDTE